MAMTVKEQMDCVEGIIDQIGLAGLLDMTAEVCREKSEHLITNWQDPSTARVWTKNASTIEHAARHIMT